MDMTPGREPNVTHNYAALYITPVLLTDHRHKRKALIGQFCQVLGEANIEMVPLQVVIAWTASKSELF